MPTSLRFLNETKGSAVAKDVCRPKFPTPRFLIAPGMACPLTIWQGFRTGRNRNHAAMLFLLSTCSIYALERAIPDWLSTHFRRRVRNACRHQVLVGHLVRKDRYSASCCMIVPTSCWAAEAKLQCNKNDRTSPRLRRNKSKCDIRSTSACLCQSKQQVPKDNCNYPRFKSRRSQWGPYKVFIGQSSILQRPELRPPKFRRMRLFGLTTM